jgi:hypothetical protein
LLNCQWFHTPLDFAGREECELSKLWAYYTHILRILHLPVYSRPVTVKPRDRIPSDTWLQTDLPRELLSAPFIIGFCITLLSAWNFSFPTPIERLLWRIATGFFMAGGLISGVWLMLMEHVVRKRRTKKAIPSSDTVLPSVEQDERSRSVAEKLRNISRPLDPELKVHLRVLIPMTIGIAIYCIMRLYVLVEDIIGLRNLPPSAFKTVEWTKYIPHF